MELMDSLEKLACAQEIPHAVNALEFGLAHRTASNCVNRQDNSSNNPVVGFIK